MALTRSLSSSHEVSDEMLVRRAIDGDAAAFELIVRRHNQRLYRLARAIVGDDAAARDVLQEAYVKMFYKLPTFKGPDGFTSWLRAIVRNEALMSLRAGVGLTQLKENLELLQELISPRQAPPERALERRQLQSFADASIDKLPAKLRCVFILREVEELSVSETSDFLNITEDTVKTRLSRAKKFLQQRIGHRLRQQNLNYYEFAGRRCDKLTAAVMAQTFQLMS